MQFFIFLFPESQFEKTESFRKDSNGNSYIFAEHFLYDFI